MYLIKFKIDTDGDFTYDESDVVFEVCKTKEKAIQRMLERFDITINSIGYVDNKTKALIAEELTECREYIESLDVEDKIDICCGFHNWDAEFEIIKVNFI